jgi:hypothetical protein
MFKQNASDQERVEAAEKYFDELLRDSYGGINCKHKNVAGKNVVEVFIVYPAENGGDCLTSEELITFKGNSDEFDEVETLREIS